MVNFWLILFANGFLPGLSGWHFFESRQAYRKGLPLRLIGVSREKKNQEEYEKSYQQSMESYTVLSAISGS